MVLPSPPVSCLLKADFSELFHRTAKLLKMSGGVISVPHVGTVCFCSTITYVRRDFFFVLNTSCKRVIVGLGFFNMIFSAPPRSRAKQDIQILWQMNQTTPSSRAIKNIFVNLPLSLLKSKLGTRLVSMHKVYHLLTGLPWSASRLSGSLLFTLFSFCLKKISLLFQI